MELDLKKGKNFKYKFEIELYYPFKYEEGDDEEKKGKQEQEELYKEPGMEDPSRPPLIGTESGSGEKVEKELKEAGEYAANKIGKRIELWTTFTIVKGGIKKFATLKRLSKGEINILKKEGYDIHKLKKGLGGGRVDIFKDRKGNLYVLPKNAKGEPWPLNINIKDLKK